MSLNYKYIRQYAPLYEEVAFIGLARRAEAVIFERMGMNSLSVLNVAAQLEMPVRSFQRKLRVSGKTYSEIRDICRLSAALELLLETSYSMTEISAHLDFTDRTSFTSACRRWLGVSPKEFRCLHKVI